MGGQGKLIYRIMDIATRNQRQAILLKHLFLSRMAHHDSILLKRLLLRCMALHDSNLFKRLFCQMHGTSRLLSCSLFLSYMALDDCYLVKTFVFVTYGT